MNTLTVKPVDSLLAEPQNLWHALHGYDFAGLESVLSFGLEASDNQGERCGCFSLAPEVAHSMNREAGSFVNYSLGDNLTLSVTPRKQRYPEEEYGGFGDEVRLTPRELFGLTVGGVMLPDHILEQALETLPPTSHPRKPAVAVRYMEKSTDYLDTLGSSKLTSELVAELAPLWGKSAAGHELTIDENDLLEQSIFVAYSEAVTNISGIEQPTTADMLAIILKRTGQQLPVYTWQESIRRKIHKTNRKIATIRRSMFHTSRPSSLVQTFDIEG